jgi:hypothetical protein
MLMVGTLSLCPPYNLDRFYGTALWWGSKDIHTGFLTKEEMLKSYYEAADYLHVGSP